MCLVSKPDTEIKLKLLNYVVKHLCCEPGINPEPECLIHHRICVLKIIDYSVIKALEIWLFGYISGKKKSSANLVLIEVLKKIFARGARSISDGNG